MQVFHDEQGPAGVGHLFAELLGSTGVGEVQREMRLQETHLQQAQVFLGDHAAVAERQLAPEQCEGEGDAA